MLDLRSTKFWTLFLLLLPTTLFASGKLRGVVIDSTTREPLVGASILLVGTAHGASADLEGHYVVDVIPAGRYKVRCSYIGYLSKDAEVTISDDKTTQLDFVLMSVNVQGKEVVITAQAGGQAAAINRQVTSDKIENVVSEAKIRELPDANAAEALGRLPGISIVRSGGEASEITLRGLSEDYTTITLDGTRLSATDADSRGVDLSTIAQGSLSGITVTKAITADMDGSAIAGNVNFETKTAPDSRSIQVTAQGSYGALDNAYNQYNFYGNYGERFFNKVLGVQLFGNIEQRNRSSENYSVAYDQTLNNNTNWEINDFTIQYAPETRRRRGARLLLDVMTPDGGVVKFDGDVDVTERRLSMIGRDYPIEWASPEYTFTGEDISTHILSMSLQGKNNLAGWQVNWNLSFTQSSTDNPYNYSLDFVEPSTLDSAGNVLSGMKTIPVALRKGPYQNLIPYAVDNFNYSYFDYANIRTNNNLDYQRTASLDIKRDYSFSDMSGELKFGGKFNDHYHRRNNNYYFAPYYNGVQETSSMLLPDGSIVPKNWAAYGFGNLKKTGGLILMTNFIDNSTRNVYGLYSLDPLIDPNIMRNWYDISVNGIDPNTKMREYADGTAEDGTGYGADETVGAAYLMNTLNFGTFATLIAGIRFEADNDNYASFYTTQPLSAFSVFSDTSATHAESIVLPNFHLILRPTDFMNVRFAAYRGITRPDFNYRLPTYLLIGTAAYVGTDMVKMGNTGLKNGSAWNYEVNLQFYGSAIGLLSVSSYFKRIDNEVEYLNGFPIFPNTNLADSMGIHFLGNQRPFSTTYYLSYPYNSSKPTYVWGFEVEQQTNFLFLPGVLRGIILNYNLSLVKNQTYTPFASIYYDTTYVAGFPVPKPAVRLIEEKSRIVNSPEFFCNIVLGYDIAGFSARLSYFYQDSYYNGFSFDQRSNPMQNSFARMDLALKQNLSEHLAIGLNIDNLTNYSEGTSIQNTITGWTLQTSSVRYGTNVNLWLRVTM